MVIKAFQNEKQKNKNKSSVTFAPLLAYPKQIIYKAGYFSTGKNFAHWFTVERACYDIPKRFQVLEAGVNSPHNTNVIEET